VTVLDLTRLCFRLAQSRMIKMLWI